MSWYRFHIKNVNKTQYISLILLLHIYLNMEFEKNEDRIAT